VALCALSMNDYFCLNSFHNQLDHPGSCFGIERLEICRLSSKSLVLVNLTLYICMLNRQQLHMRFGVGDREIELNNRSMLVILKPLCSLNACFFVSFVTD